MIELAGPESRSLQSRRLWSLWDILKVNAKEFYFATSVILTIDGAIRDGLEGPDAVAKASDRLNPTLIDTAKRLLDELLPNLRALGAKQTIKSAERLRNEAERGDLTYGHFSSVVADIDMRLRDELSDTVLFAVDQRKAEALNAYFTDDEIGRFPCLRTEMANAASCYAFGLNTACVYHSVRCLEAGIKALSKALGAPQYDSGPERTWGKMLERVRGCLRDRFEKGPLSEERQFYENAVAMLAATQNPWRNATMHLDLSDYSDEECRFIFEAVRQLMKKLASRMDENGVSVA